MIFKLLVGVLVVLSLPALLAAREIEVQLERPDLVTPEAKKLVEKLGSGDIAAGLKEAEMLTKKHPGNIELWHILGALQAQLRDTIARTRGVLGQELRPLPGSSWAVFPEVDAVTEPVVFIATGNQMILTCQNPFSDAFVAAVKAEHESRGIHISDSVDVACQIW